MEFTLHVVLYTLEGEDRFKVMAATPDCDEPTDVTGHYEVTAIQTEDGRAGFAVLPKPAEAKKDCPYAAHAADCDCEGMGGDR